MFFETICFQLSLSALCVVLGAVIGSATLCYYMRRAAGESWVTERSHCDSCHAALKSTDLIPILSYWAPNGRCRYCGNQVPKVYFHTECVFGAAGFFISLALNPLMPILVRGAFALLGILVVFIYSRRHIRNIRTKGRRYPK